MANFNGRRAPNFAQYLDDLNAIPSPYDQAVQQRQQENTFNLDEELALFTNTEFFDFEKFTDLGLPNFDAVDQKSSPVESIADQATQNADMKFLEFLNVAQLMSWLDVVFNMLDVPISTPGTTIPFFWTLPTRVIGVLPLGLQDIHVEWRVQILSRACDRCRAIGLVQT
ncbi:hypothetical protein PENSUB_6166 [Penicillium subrubescens]|uniref:Uncharacterized protein n=1 Tax=Penicillium subrubescens TaxID=1316194 RepID=A0A1Q5U3D7_9EURO|nr:hypothetical protein PENSUB_6166 [Penicillium subrubescens]